jgi:pyruvate kinase
LIVTGIEPGRITCRVTAGGVLSDRKGLNVPNVRLSVSAITEKDERDLAFGRDIGVDWFALSFVRDAADVRRCKILAGNVPVIAKLEKPEAVESLAEIVDASDGIMVARGDLGVEAGLERVPVIQKRAIELANRQGKLVITATQMLESMIQHPRPTRAEASDVANAIFDGSDVVMLSGETAVGAYPVETVKMMASIIEQVEQSEPYLARNLPDAYGAAWQSDNATARAAATLSRSVKLAAIVVLANDVTWLDILADYRPLCPIVALVADTAVARRSALQWGVVSRVVEMPESQRDLIALSEAKTRECVGAQSGDDIAILAPSLPERAGKTLTLWKIR